MRVIHSQLLLGQGDVAVVLLIHVHVLNVAACSSVRQDSGKEDAASVLRQFLPMILPNQPRNFSKSRHVSCFPGLDLVSLSALPVPYQFRQSEKATGQLSQCHIGQPGHTTIHDQQRAANLRTSPWHGMISKQRLLHDRICSPRGSRSCLPSRPPSLFMWPLSPVHRPWRCTPPSGCHAGTQRRIPPRCPCASAAVASAQTSGVEDGTCPHQPAHHHHQHPSIIHHLRKHSYANPKPVVNEPPGARHVCLTRQ